MSFRALLLVKEGEQQSAAIKNLEEDALMDGDVLVETAFSSLNYKDGLALTGAAPVVRHWPMIPGIDLAGKVITSSHAGVEEGARIVVNGFGLGETHYGGYAQRARLKGEWITPLPPAINARQAMAIGTAGYTAMLCVLALEKHDITPETGPIAVSGAAGGVGSVAIMLLAALGYKVSAITGRQEEADYLRALGAAEILPRSDFTGKAPPIGKARFAGAVDSAGGEVLANILAQMMYGGCAAACGLANSMMLPASVAPFILRGVTLCGVDSVMAPQKARHQAYERLARDLDFALLEKRAGQTVPLAETTVLAPQILAGKVRGRTIVDVNA